LDVILKSSGELIPADQDEADTGSGSEVEFALVITRMIDSVKNDPADLRQAIYDLARYKLQEQFTYADAKDVKRTQQALEGAIRGVEAFSRKHDNLPLAAPHTQTIGTETAATQPLPLVQINAPVEPRRRKPAGFASGEQRRLSHLPRLLLLVALVIGIALAIQQRDVLVGFVQDIATRVRLARVETPSAPAATLVPAPQPAAAPAPKPARLLPTDYGVYALANDALFDLRALPVRAPDMRVAISPAITTPSATTLPGNQPKFILFRRDAAGLSNQIDVRLVAKVSREFSAGVAGKPPAADNWIIRNIAVPFRTSPIKDNPGMYEIHAADPALQLTPGRYALVLDDAAYDFSIEGTVVDIRQCLEQIEATNGVFYAECRKP
jgi:hypothetical protein